MKRLNRTIHTAHVIDTQPTCRDCHQRLSKINGRWYSKTAGSMTCRVTNKPHACEERAEFWFVSIDGDAFLGVSDNAHKEEYDFAGLCELFLPLGRGTIPMRIGKRLLQQQGATFAAVPKAVTDIPRYVTYLIERPKTDRDLVERHIEELNYLHGEMLIDDKTVEEATGVLYVLKPSALPPGRTPWQVICPEHGPVSISETEYQRQMNNPNLRWKCPKCGEVAAWDDDNYDRHMSAMEGDHA